MAGYDDQYVYHGTSKARGAIFNLPAQEPTIDKVGKYGIR
jgi:hypothetical protein